MYFNKGTVPLDFMLLVFPSITPLILPWCPRLTWIRLFYSNFWIYSFKKFDTNKYWFGAVKKVQTFGVKIALAHIFLNLKILCKLPRCGNQWGVDLEMLIVQWKLRTYVGTKRGSLMKKQTWKIWCYCPFKTTFKIPIQLASQILVTLSLW